jgi:type IV pilus assembly protein PilB
MADPLDVIAIDTITLKTKRQLKVVISSHNEIRRAIEMIYHGSDVEEQHLRDLVENEVGREEQQDDLEEILETDIDSEVAATKAPVIRFVDLLLSQAIKSRASDIHIEPQEHSMVIRMRIDGVLREMIPPSGKMQAAVVTRIKILSAMDIAERRLPQDGRFKVKNSGRDIDVRVSVIPTIYGEKVVMRILDAAATSHDIDMLGFEPKLLEEFKTILSQPHGIIIVTGPTGSGKSTTLYSALHHLRSSTDNITTVEDPVEYRLAGVNQIQVKPEIGLDFAVCLRAILRQDPDIILVGEIRDKETVEIAIKASLTGHLVLSTFHTNDAPSAISRLVYMGIEPYLLASSLNLIVAQRLVRKICDRCKEPVTLEEQVVKRLGITPEQAKNAVFYHGKGCKACGDTGYSGRLPIFEFLVIDNDMREALVTGQGESKIRVLARQKGYGGLLESGINKMLQGLTTAEEVLTTAFTENIKV